MMHYKKPFLSIIILFVLVSFPFINTVGASSELWSQTYGGEYEEVAYALVQTTDGGYALAGSIGEADFWLVKTDAYGNMEWNQTYGGPVYDVTVSLLETSDGGYAITGASRLVKTDVDGKLEWNQTYTEGIPNSLVETADGGYVLAGETSSLDAGRSDFWLVKTDDHGIIPEFPSWTIVPLLLVATLAAVTCKQRLTKKSERKK